MGVCRDSLRRKGCVTPAETFALPKSEIAPTKNKSVKVSETVGLWLLHHRYFDIEVSGLITWQCCQWWKSKKRILTRYWTRKKTQILQAKRLYNNPIEAFFAQVLKSLGWFPLYRKGHTQEGSGEYIWESLQWYHLPCVNLLFKNNVIHDFLAEYWAMFNWSIYHIKSNTKPLSLSRISLHANLKPIYQKE